MKMCILMTLAVAMGVHAKGEPLLCVPDVGTVFSDYQNKSFTISNDVLGVNNLYSQCSNMSDQQIIAVLDGCGPLEHPINGLGLSPQDQFLYGLMPTDGMGIGTHVSFDVFPFPSPGKPGDMMKADPVDVYRIGNDGGYLRIGAVMPPDEDSPLPADTEQVIPLVHSASTFNQAGDMFVLGYKTNYQSSANVAAGTGQVLYQTPKIMIGQIDSASLTAANGAIIPATWSEVDTSSDAVCDAVMNQFRDRTNAFSACVVADYIANGNVDNAVQNCLANTAVLDFGIHDFAVSPSNGHFYALDTMSFDDTDVLIDVNANTMQASCTNYADVGNATGVMTSLMFSQQNKLVAVFANENTGRWIDVDTGVITTLADNISPFPFGDGGSIPFVNPKRSVSSFSGTGDLIFRTGFEGDLIFKDGFGDFIVIPGCPAF